MLPPLSHFLTLNYAFDVWFHPQIVRFMRTGTLSLVHPQDKVWHMYRYLLPNTKYLINILKFIREAPSPI